jgi:hypothetical protein
MRLTLARLAAGLALLTALVAGCGAASAHHAQAHKPAFPATAATHAATPAHAPIAGKDAARRDHRLHYHPAMQLAPPTPPAPPPTMNPIPQGNGGDHDADNNGGPSDGDGNI